MFYNYIIAIIILMNTLILWKLFKRLPELNNENMAFKMQWTTCKDYCCISVTNG